VSLYDYFYTMPFAASTATPPPATTWFDYVLANVTNLRVLYPLSEPSGTTMTDLGPSGLSGTYTGSPTLGITGPISGYSAATFDGATQWGSRGHDAAFNLSTSDYSVGLWLLDASWPGATQWLFAHHGDGDIGTWETQQTAVANQLQTRVAGVTVNSGTTTKNDGGWHLVGYTADRDGNAQWYCDGATDGTATSIAAASGTAIDKTATLWVARRQTTGYAAVSMAGLFMAASIVDWSALWGAR
jgi:hypothetical protein